MQIETTCALCENKGFFLTAVGFDDYENVFCGCSKGVMEEHRQWMRDNATRVSELMPIKNHGWSSRGQMYSY